MDDCKTESEYQKTGESIPYECLSDEEKELIKNLNNNTFSTVGRFSKLINTQQEYELTQGGQYNAPKRNKEELVKLPDIVQQKIREIYDASTIEEKAAIAHSFSQAYITPELQYGGNLGQERTISFLELAKDPRGDCDDFAFFTQELLVYAGVPPEKILDVTGLMKYSYDTTMIETGHAFLVVEDSENGNFYLLDNNLEGLILLDPNQPVSDANLLNIDVSVKAEITVISSAVDARGTPFENDDAFNKVTEISNVFIERLRSSSVVTTVPIETPKI